MLVCSLRQRQKDNLCDKKHPSSRPSKTPRLFSLQRRWWLQFFRMQEALWLLTDFEMPTPSIESYTPTCWGNYERRSRSIASPPIREGELSCNKQWISLSRKIFAIIYILFSSGHWRSCFSTASFSLHVWHSQIPHNPSSAKLVR